LRVPLRDFYDSYEFFCETSSGDQEMQFFLGQLKSDEVFFDIGAFRGAFSAITKAKLEGNVLVHAFEPLPRNFHAIETIRNLNAFEGFEIISKAVGANQILAGNINENDSMLRLGDRSASTTETSFAATSVDDYIDADNPAPTIMKIDVDGFELQVLHGAQRCLKTNRPRLWIEIHPEFLAAQGESPITLLRLLEDIGYKILFFADYRLGSASPYHIWCA
jgi:FkbM family methyltransferase